MLRTGQPTATEALREAHDFVAHEGPSELTEYLLDSIGPRYSAVGLGLHDARQLKAWKAGGVPRAGVTEDRLRLLTQVTRAISRVYTPDTAAAFLRSANPDLDDRSPLLVIADENPLESAPWVLRAVRAFLEA